MTSDIHTPPREVIVGAVLTEERRQGDELHASLSRARALRVPCWALALLASLVGPHDALAAVLALLD